MCHMQCFVKINFLIYLALKSRTMEKKLGFLQLKFSFAYANFFFEMYHFFAKMNFAKEALKICGFFLNLIFKFKLVKMECKIFGKKHPFEIFFIFCEIVVYPFRWKL